MPLCFELQNMFTKVNVCFSLLTMLCLFFDCNTQCTLVQLCNSIYYVYSVVSVLVILVLSLQIHEVSSIYVCISG